MRSLAATLTLSLIAACDTSTSAEPYVDGGSDASTEPAPVPRRSEPVCEALGRVESVELAPFHLTTDFFAGCPHRTQEPLPDRAFTWTAPSSGLYVFELTSNDDFAPSLSLELRRGDCALTESEGASIARTEPICAGQYYVEEGRSPPYQVLAVEENETFTLVVDGAEYLDPGEDWMQRQAIGLHVERALCPSVPVRNGGEVTRVEELPSEVPVELEIFSTSQNGRRLRVLSCFETGYPTRQYGVAWTAPEAGRYRFEAEGTPTWTALEDGGYGYVEGDSDTVRVALVQDRCDGYELACSSGEYRATASIALEANERVIVMVESSKSHVDDERFTVRVSAEESDIR